MAGIIKTMRRDLLNEVLSQTELENYMSDKGFELVEVEDKDTTINGIIKFTNYKSQMWITVTHDENNDILIEKIVNVTRVPGESTRVKPFQCYNDLRGVLDYFWDNKQYDCWLIGWLCALEGRRVGDMLNLKWFDLYTNNGFFRDRLATLEEEKTGKIVAPPLNALAKQRVTEYCELFDIDIMNNYRGKIFDRGYESARKLLKKAAEVCGITYPVGWHSFRKYYANTLYKLHIQDANNVELIQSLMGHANREMTLVYIDEWNEQQDRYNDDLVEFLLAKERGEDVEISNSPIIALKADVFRGLLSRCWDKALSGMDKFEGINELIKMAEESMTTTRKIV